jgi:hypothetical protein
LLTGISDDSRALIMTLVYQTIRGIASLMSGRIVMSEKTVMSEKIAALKIKKIVVQTTETIAAQMYPEAPITRETIIHKTTLRVVTSHVATNGMTCPPACRVLRAVKIPAVNILTIRAEKLAGSTTPILMPASVPKIAAPAITAARTVVIHRAMATSRKATKT